MEDYFDGFYEDITKWETIREMIDLDLGKVSALLNSIIFLL